MFQHTRERAVSEWITQLNAGIAPPMYFHESARVYFPAAVSRAQPRRCVICGIQLLGAQKQLCAGHWDWVLFEPLEEVQTVFDPTNALIEFLEIFMLGCFVVASTSNIETGRRSMSRCEVCDVVTANVEKLVNRTGQTTKQHVVCPDHQTFRWDEEEDG